MSSSSSSSASACAAQINNTKSGKEDKDVKSVTCTVDKAQNKEQDKREWCPICDMELGNYPHVAQKTEAECLTLIFRTKYVISSTDDSRRIIHDVLDKPDFTENCCDWCGLVCFDYGMGDAGCNFCDNSLESLINYNDLSENYLINDLSEKCPVTECENKRTKGMSKCWFHLHKLAKDIGVELDEPVKQLGNFLTAESISTFLRGEISLPDDIVSNHFPTGKYEKKTKLKKRRGRKQKAIATKRQKLE